MTDTVRICFADGTDLMARAFLANGVPEPAARSTATALVEAEAEGQTGHRFSRVENYVAQARSGKTKATAVPVTSQITPAALRNDAGHGFACPALKQAIEAGISVARDMGSASMAVTHSRRCGALSVQVRKTAETGPAGMMFANAPAAIAPWGASTPLCGTNLIAFAGPRPSSDPLVIDLSLSKMARGRVMHAHKIRGGVLDGWAFDARGQPTTDPANALVGTMAPIGEAKGTALALIVEIFAALMTGASVSKDVSSFFDADGPPPNVGPWLLAMQPLAGLDFAKRLDALLGITEAMELARVPGARHVALSAMAHSKGLDAPKRYIDSITRLSKGTSP